MAKPTKQATLQTTNSIENLRTRLNTLITNANQLYDNVGNAESLLTDSNNLSNAVNELYSDMGDVSTLTTLTSNVVAAINEVRGNVSASLWQTMASNVELIVASNINLKDSNLVGIKEINTNSNQFIVDSGANTVIVNGSTFPTTFGTVDQVLSTDGAGTLTWATGAMNAGANLWVTSAGSAALITPDTVNMQSQKILNLARPTANSDAATLSEISNSTYRMSFANADLSLGHNLEVPHNLGERWVLSQVFNNTGNLIIPDNANAVNTTTLLTNVDGYVPLTGNYTIVVSK